MPKAAAETIEVAGVALTNPNRVLWPKQGVTKRGLAEYYAGIADRILVIYKGRIIGERPARPEYREEIGALMSGKGAEGGVEVSEAGG